MTRRMKKKDYEVLAEFRYTLRQFIRFSEEAAQSVGITPQQHQALLAVMGYPGREQITIGELSERLQIKHHSVVGLVDRLVAQGLIERQPAEDDRRKVFVKLTPHGLEVLERLTTAHKEELHRLGPQLHKILEDLRLE